ncbi:MAG: ACP S-malonyltransferase [Clostridia bacterium]
MKIAFIYAGQGSQFEKMGEDLYKTQPIFAKTLDAIDKNGKIKQLCFEGSIEELSKTSNTQPCMVAFAIAITRMLKDYGIYPEITAGLSLGEYSALNCANVLNDEQSLELVTFRGEQMEQASQGLNCKMYAILGIERKQLKKACEQASNLGIVSIANYNCPGQIVIAGESDACKKASDLALELGAKRAIELNVSGPFHTKLMKSAGLALNKRFTTEKFGEMQIPVVFNVLGTEKSKETNIKLLLEKQVQSSVYFEDSIRYMIKNGVDTFVEIGGGKTLTGFIKKISKDVATYQVFDVKSLENTLCKIKGETVC